MEYERIHKPQNGIISPSKLRMKLIGAQNQRQRDESNSTSSRTSPSKLHHDSDFAKNSLLATQSNDFEEEARVDSVLHQPKDLIPREDEDSDRAKLQRLSKGDGYNPSLVQPVRSNEDETVDYDSTSSFQFHESGKSLQHHVTRSFSRPASSKWNDADKWIMSRHNLSKNPSLQNQLNRVSTTSSARNAPESNGYEHNSSVKRVDFYEPAIGHDKFAFVQGNAANVVIDLCPESKDLMEVDNADSSCAKSSMQDTIGTSPIRSVSMRDMGTEMTPIPSQEPSRTATPLEATTPIRSPTSSIPSTPRRGEPTPIPADQFTNYPSQHSTIHGKKELSEQELKLETRREIVALGVQLGKMNIAAWASKEEKERNKSANGASDPDEQEQIEYAKRAAAWEEAENSKHAARFKREEITIQAWESQQKAKLEAEMRRTEAQVEQMKAQAQVKMVKKIAMARQKSEEMRAAAEARRNREAEKVAAEAEYIRQTGRIPSSYFICCGWSR